MMIKSSRGSLSLWRRKNSRSMRLTRLRFTALPKRLVTTSPSRGLPACPGAKVMPKWRVCSRRPWARARRKSARYRRRSALRKRAVPGDEAVGMGAERRLCSVGWLRWAPRLLHAQAFAASGPAALQHLTPPPGTHAAQKAVGARPAQIAGLKCAFHGKLSFGTQIFPNFL